MVRWEFTGKWSTIQEKKCLCAKVCKISQGKRGNFHTLTMIMQPHAVTLEFSCESESVTSM